MSKAYRRALHAALREWERAAAEHAALEQRMARLQQTIGSLSRLCGLEPTVPLGLTDACRLVLRSAGRPLTAPEVRDRLEATGLDLDKYANALAAIHTTLKRLTAGGEASASATDETSRVAYAFLRSGVVASRVGPPVARPGARQPARSHRKDAKS
jgi:hypothetical protein